MLRLSSISRRARRMSLGFLAALGVAGAVAACSSAATGNATSGKITVLLTDAPGDVKTAVVTISQIYLQGNGEEASGRVILRDTPITTDLLTLANSTADLVKDATVPAGTYGQHRFVITGGYVEIENPDGTTSIFSTAPNYAGLPAGATVAGSLQMPSFASSGLKVNLPGGSVRIDAEQTILLVDFDVSRSYGKEAGISGKWVMSPVLTATDLSFSGGLKVSLSKAPELTMPSVSGAPVTLGQFKATLTKEGGSTEELALTDADNNGTFEATFKYVVAGNYTVDFVAPAGVSSFTTNPARPTAVSITSGNTGSHAAVLTAAAN